MSYARLMNNVSKVECAYIHFRLLECKKVTFFKKGREFPAKSDVSITIFYRHVSNKRGSGVRRLLDVLKTCVQRQ